MIATGEHDHLVQAIRDFAAMLACKGLIVHAEFWGGVFGRDWPHWSEHFRRFVP